jgi:hypothetical protein
VKAAARRQALLAIATALLLLHALPLIILSLLLGLAGASIL